MINLVVIQAVYSLRLFHSNPTTKKPKGKLFHFLFFISLLSLSLHLSILFSPFLFPFSSFLFSFPFYHSPSPFLYCFLSFSFPSFPFIFLFPFLPFSGVENQGLIIVQEILFKRLKSLQLFWWTIKRSRNVHIKWVKLNRTNKFVHIWQKFWQLFI